jgi:hypothetical protein
MTMTDSSTGVRVNCQLNSVSSSLENKAITHHTQFGAFEVAVILSSESVLESLIGHDEVGRMPRLFQFPLWDSFNIIKSRI